MTLFAFYFGMGNSGKRFFPLTTTGLDQWIGLTKLGMLHGDEFMV